MQKNGFLINFSSSGSSVEPEFADLRRENEEEGGLSRSVSPASSNIGFLTSHCHPSLFAGVLIFRGLDVEPVVKIAPRLGGHTRTPSSM